VEEPATELDLENRPGRLRADRLATGRGRHDNIEDLRLGDPAPEEVGGMPFADMLKSSIYIACFEEYDASTGVPGDGDDVPGGVLDAQPRKFLKERIPC
jgi:hypothetical protein